MNRFFLSLSCVVASAPLWAADPAQAGGEGGDRLQRRAELRQAIASHKLTVPDVPVRTLSDRERAELREQLRRESATPRDARGQPGARPMQRVSRP